MQAFHLASKLTLQQLPALSCARTTSVLSHGRMGDPLLTGTVWRAAVGLLTVERMRFTTDLRMDLSAWLLLHYRKWKIGLGKPVNLMVSFLFSKVLLCGLLTDWCLQNRVCQITPHQCLCFYVVRPSNPAELLGSPCFAWALSILQQRLQQAGADRTERWLLQELHQQTKGVFGVFQIRQKLRHVHRVRFLFLSCWCHKLAKWGTLGGVNVPMAVLSSDGIINWILGKNYSWKGWLSTGTGPRRWS